MIMKNLIVFLILCVLTINSAFAQNYKSHKVLKGENVYRIAKQYNTTVDAILSINPNAKDGIKEGEILAIPVTGDQQYKIHEVADGDTVFSLAKQYNTTVQNIYGLNPDAVNGIKAGQILRVGKVEKKDPVNDVEITENGKLDVLDSLKTVPVEPKVIGYKTHKVKRKETLFGISKEYGITVEDIKRHNKRLYSEQLQKKDKIRIPIYDETPVIVTPVETSSGSDRVSSTTTYIIKPKDTRYSIARRHGITVAELENLNPNLDPLFPIGTEITVPSAIFVPLEETVEPGFELYEVQPKETIYSLLTRLKIPADSLFKMNPYLKDGLKAGAVLVIPKREVDTANFAGVEENEIVDLKNKLYNFKTKKLGVMFPFNLEKLNFEEVSETEDYLKKRQSVRIAVDFYQGVQLAVDSVKALGISTELFVYDTKQNNNGGYLKKLIAENNFEVLDAVIGPMYPSNVDTVVKELKKYNTPVFSPISKKDTESFNNFFQTRPGDKMLQDKLISYIKKDSTDKNIVLIVQQGAKFDSLRNRLKTVFPLAKIAKLQEGNYLYEVDLNKVLDKDRKNWVILESDDVAMISNVTPFLNAKAESHQITLFTTDKNSAFDDDSISNEHLSKLQLHYPSVDKESDEISETDSFVKNYKAKYGVAPNKYIVRGFDIAYDVLLRLGTAEDLYQAANFRGTTEYNENKFDYMRDDDGGFYNKAVYLIKFNDNLELSVIE